MGQEPRLTGPWRPPRAVLAAAAALLAGLAVLLGYATPLGDRALRPDSARAVVDHAAQGRGDAADIRTGATPLPGGTGDLTRDELTGLIAGQNDALARRDAAAFLVPYAADRPDLRAERGRLFANLLKIPFSRAEYRYQDAQPVPAESAGRRRTSTVTVVFSHQITGVDVAPIGETYRWTVTRPGPGEPLAITAVDGGAPDTAHRNTTYPAPWDAAELVLVDKPHVLLLAAKQHQAKAALWATRAEAAATRNLASWQSPEPTPGRFVVFLTPDHAAFERVRGGDTVTTNAIGVCVSLPADPAGRGPATPDFAGSRIYVDSTAQDITTGKAEDTIAIFRHEMGHAMVAPFQKRVAGNGPPLWVAEGFAGYLEWSDRSLERWYVPAARDQVRSGTFGGKLPTDEQIYADDPRTSSAGYHFAMLAIRYIAEKYGAAKAYAFVIAVYRDPASVGAALRTATGLDHGQFEAKWAQYVKAKAG
ncbi:hypothetical protein GCM10023205_12860 [Yinghuangia aomiensis]|uniref:Peptidase n=1 Tax=Yinghuangia aomiensis TaxID=676205 RepID=A0ABP9H1T7_9ACTN